MESRMTDDELQNCWPELGALVKGLRCINQSDVADKLVEAFLTGSSSSEVVGGIGIILRDHRDLRPQLSDSAISAWDAIMVNVARVLRESKFAQWLDRLAGQTGEK